MSSQQPFAVYAARMHRRAGHDVTARLLGPSLPAGDCTLCAYEARPTIFRWAAVVAALRPARPTLVCWHVLPYCDCPPGRPKRPHRAVI